MTHLDSFGGTLIAKHWFMVTLVSYHIDIGKIITGRPDIHISTIAVITTDQLVDRWIVMTSRPISASTAYKIMTCKHLLMRSKKDAPNIKVRENLCKLQSVSRILILHVKIFMMASCIWNGHYINLVATMVEGIQIL